MQTSLGLATWLHLVAAVLWMGGVLTLLYIVWPELKSALGFSSARTRIAYGVVRRFTWVFLTCIVVLIASGIYMMREDENYLGILDFRNTWSKLLVFKHALFVVMVAAAIYIGFVVNPRIGRSLKEGRHAAVAAKMAVRQRRMAYLNIALILLILLITGLLTGI